MKERIGLLERGILGVTKVYGVLGKGRGPGGTGHASFVGHRIRMYYCRRVSPLNNSLCDRLGR